MTESNEFYIGIMSGTSLDGIDVALVDFSSQQPLLVASSETRFPASLKKNLEQIADGNSDSFELFAGCDREIAALYAEQVKQVLEKTNTKPGEINAIGCHGQTIRHRPNSDKQGYTFQAGDPNVLAELSGINVIADFRRRDIAAGGEGAPLAPGFHHAVFRSNEIPRIIVNIGGIGNITILHSGKAVRGFDTGPGNRLMDYWIAKTRQQAYDKKGEWAASGRINTALLENFLSDDYFSEPIPKSTGREYFNPDWLETRLVSFPGISPEDIQATLLELTAQTIIRDIEKYAPQTAEIYICGGGAYNDSLMQRLEQLAPDATVQATSVLGVEPCWVEAMAFAWLARQYEKGLPGNLPGVTGASGERVLGALYKA